MSDQLTQRINNAIEAAIPHLQFNGFATAFGTGDVMLVLEYNGKPVATASMSFTVAKTLANSLGSQITRLEAVSGHPIMTTFDVEKFLIAINEQDKQG